MSDPIDPALLHDAGVACAFLQRLTPIIKLGDAIQTLGGIDNAFRQAQGRVANANARAAVLDAMIEKAKREADEDIAARRAAADEEIAKAKEAAEAAYATHISDGEAKAAAIIAGAETRAAGIVSAAEERGRAAATDAAQAEAERLRMAHEAKDAELAAKGEKLSGLAAEEQRILAVLAAARAAVGLGG